MGSKETPSVVDTVGFTRYRHWAFTPGDVYVRPLPVEPDTTTDELSYPDGFDYSCSTCTFLAKHYGPDDAETISHAGEGKHTYAWIKVGRISAKDFTYKYIDPKAITYFNPS